MTDEFQIQALGAQFRVIVTGMSGADLRRLAHQWGRLAGWGEPSDTVRVVAGSRAVDADVSGETFDAVSVALRQTINLRAIIARRRDLLTFHAAGLADPSTGDVIALIGPSGAGKTTAAATLGTRLGYVSDETVAVAEDGRVVPFPKPLAMKVAGAPDKTVHSPDALGLAHTDGNLRLARIALLDRTDEPVAPEITTLGLPAVLSEVVEQINCFDALPRPLHVVTDLVRRCGGVQVIRYHHAADLVDPVRELLRRPAAPAEVRVYRRVAVDDWVDVEGEVLALIEGRVSRLGPVGSLLWRLLEHPQPLDGLLGPVEAAFGRPPGGDTGRALLGQLGDLVQTGLLTAGPPEAPVSGPAIAVASPPDRASTVLR